MKYSFILEYLYSDEISEIIIYNYSKIKQSWLKLIVYI